MFARLAVSALIAGFGAGLVAALLQYVFVQPILLHSELFETGALIHFGADSTASSVPRGDFDISRQALNVIFAALVYTGYALILLAGMVLAEQQGHVVTPKTGLIWGLCGFLTFQLAPAFGLPPDMPGLNAAEVAPRQIWWFATAGATGLGLWFIAFGKNWTMWGIAIVLLAAPHVIGAPTPDTYAGPAPPEMAADFAAKTLGTTCAIWAALGCLLGAVWTSKLSEV
jgi:cobalt transporter subunit CbtA